MLSLTLDYFILVLAVCMGVLQVAAGYSRLYGLMLVPRPRAAYAIGLALPAGAFTWFILIGDASTPGDLGGVEGAEQFVLFLAGAALSTVITALLASLTQARRPGRPQPGRGLDAFREATLLQLIGARLRVKSRAAVERRRRA